jgi:hypothetical protein
MVVGLWIMGSRARKKLPAAVVWLFPLGLVYGVVDTLPVALLFHSLACDCNDPGLVGTEFCQGRDPFCILSRCAVFILIAIFYAVADLNCQLYLRMTESRFQKQHLKWAFPATTAIAVVCAALSYALDIDPQENPDVPLAALILVRDSFSCSPRLPSFASDMVLRQIHFILGSVVVAVAVIRILIIVMGVSVKTGTTEKKRRGSLVRTTLESLRKKRAERLILMGLIFTILFAVNMFVTVKTLPVLETFRSSADNRLECLVAHKAICGGYDACSTEFDENDPCTVHDDCDHTEYCRANGMCGRCFECYLKNDGVNGQCPVTQCSHDHSMNDREWCAFSSCGEEIFAARANLGTAPSISALLRFGAVCDVGTLESTCVDGVANIFRCLEENNCLAQTEKCQDPHLELEGCACDGSSTYAPGCYRGQDVLTSRWYEVANETACEMSLLLRGEDPTKLLIPGARGSRHRNTCCFESSPLWGEGITPCPLPAETPNLFMCLGFFSLNCIPLVGPLVFMGTSSFWTAWKKIWSHTQKFQNMNSVASSSVASSADKHTTSDYVPSD